jgi:hypothetical protein
MPRYRGVLVAVFRCVSGLRGLRPGLILALIPAVISVWMIASTANVTRALSAAAATVSATGAVSLTVVWMIVSTATVTRPSSTAAATVSATGVVWIAAASRPAIVA